MRELSLHGLVIEHRQIGVLLVHVLELKKWLKLAFFIFLYLLSIARNRVCRHLSESVNL